MKMCSDCNVEMIDNCKIDAQHTFDLSADSSISISLLIPTNEQGSFLGMKFNKHINEGLNAKVCPNCGKVDFYISTDQIKNNDKE